MSDRTKADVNIGQLVAMICIIVLLVAIVILYETRTSMIQRYITADPLFDAIPATERLDLSANSRISVLALIRRHPELEIVSVVADQLDTNTRTPLLTVFNDPKVEASINLIDRAEGPLGTTDLFNRDPINNAQMSALLNGQFTCTSAAMNVQYVVKYRLGAKITQVCRLPVPPYYGKLTGHLTMFINRELSIYQMDDLRAAAIGLALEIYRNDIVAAPRYQRLLR